MLLYIWIRKYNNLRNIGINLTSGYHFEFHHTETDGKLTGKLTVTPTPGGNLFAPYINDIKAVIGKNGSGKTSTLNAILNALFADRGQIFNGFLVTEQYILNRSEIVIKNEVKLDETLLKLINNEELANADRQHFQKRIDSERAATVNKKFGDTYLRNHCVVYYANTLNYDRVGEGLDIVAGNGVYEVDYYFYRDISTPAQIVADKESFGFLNNLDTGESELLSHKSAETERILQYLLKGNLMPFDIVVPDVDITLNQFQHNFWDRFEQVIKEENELFSTFQEILTNIRTASENLGKSRTDEFIENLSERLLLFLLKYELNERESTANTYNAYASTLSQFAEFCADSQSFQEAVTAFLSRATSLVLFTNAPASYLKLLAFIRTAQKQERIRVQAYQLSVPLTNKKFLSSFLRQVENLFVRTEELFEETVTRGFKAPVFFYSISDLSGGEKTYLHLLSRFEHVFSRIPVHITDVVLLLDEPETSFHPQWQKEFIEHICAFFAGIKKKKKVQLIIASHSPVIISDLPKKHIVFLDKPADGQPPRLAQLRSINNTFGANIHAIYQDAFFMTGGTIGSFAKQAIFKAARIIKNKQTEHQQEAKDIIDLIGDELIYKQLSEMYTAAFGELTGEQALLEQEIKELQTRLIAAISKRK